MTKISLRIATYNIRKALGNERRGNPEPTLRVIEALNADILLIRASRRRQLAALRAFAGHSQITAKLAGGDVKEWSGPSHPAGLGPDFRVLPGPRTFHARKPVAALDRAALTDDFILRGIRTVLTPEARRASDHLPLVADLTLKGA